MPEYLAPGTYTEEVTFRIRTISGAGTTTCLFVGPTHLGPTSPDALPLLTGFDEFTRLYGDDSDLSHAGGTAPNYIAHAARAFFSNGGRKLHIARVVSGARDADDSPALPGIGDYADALTAAAGLDGVNMLAAPGATAHGDAEQAAAVMQLLIEHASREGRRGIAVLDTPPDTGSSDARAFAARFDSSHAALYYPWVKTVAPGSSTERMLPPSGFVCGIYARVDNTRGVHKAPANEVIAGSIGFESKITDGMQETLNPLGINCLRTLTARGHRVWGARTLSSDPEWKYVNVRRYFHYLQDSIEDGTRWIALEPNGAALWLLVRQTVESFLHEEWRNRALLGSSARQAYFVRCDASTMTQQDIDTGRVVCQLGIAMLRPGEFMMLRFAWQAVPV